MVVDCPDAVVTRINAGIAGEHIDSAVVVTDTALRTWVMRRDATDLRSVSIAVVPTFPEKIAASRSQNEYIISPYVFVTKSVNPKLNSEVDPLARLVVQIRDYLDRQNLTGTVTEYKWFGQEEVEAPEEVLAKERTFWAGFQVMYKAHD